MSEVRYVIVVHGMGVSKPNETVLGVVSRFADERSGRTWPPPPDIATLGAAAGQIGRGARPSDPWKLPPGVPWLEFDGIPLQRPANPLDEPFLGKLADPADGRHVRFVDIHWKDLMKEDFPEVGQSPNVWLDGLLGRLRRKHAAAVMQAVEAAASAVTAITRHIRQAPFVGWGMPGYSRAVAITVALARAHKAVRDARKALARQDFNGAATHAHKAVKHATDIAAMLAALAAGVAEKAEAVADAESTDGALAIARECVELLGKNVQGLEQAEQALAAAGAAREAGNADRALVLARQAVARASEVASGVTDLAAFDAKVETFAAAAGREVPQWALELLGALRETVKLVHGVMAFKAQGIDKTVFNDYLGDVQLYGEYAYTRGRAVRRFHELMAYVARKHDDAETKRVTEGVAPTRRTAKYTVIAHSLGTVMSMDALLYAHARLPFRDGSANPQPNLPFPGYFTTADRELLAKAPAAPVGGAAPSDDYLAWKALQSLLSPAHWITHVDTFVTLGSPIDKFLVIWWLNYQYLHDPGSWMDPALARGTGDALQKIRHYNYSEAQDPVGDNLDVARTATAFDAVFENVEDKIATRYAIPGLAHIHYWHDQALFNRIVARTIDPVAAPPPMEWFSRQVFWWAMFFTYWAIPWIAIVVNAVFFFFALKAERWYKAIAPTLVLFGIWLMARYLIDLMIWWRQIMKSKDPVEVQSDFPVAARPGDIPTALKSKVILDPSTQLLHAVNLSKEFDCREINKVTDPRLKQELSSLADKAERLRRMAEPSWVRDLGRFIRSLPPFLGKSGDSDESNQRYQSTQEGAFRGSIRIYLWLLCLAVFLVSGWFCLSHPGMNGGNIKPSFAPIRILEIAVVFGACWVAWAKLNSSDSVADTVKPIASEFYGTRKSERLFKWDDLKPFVAVILSAALGYLVFSHFEPRITQFLGGVRFLGAFPKWTLILGRDETKVTIGAFAAMGVMHFGYVKERIDRIRRSVNRDRYRPIDFRRYGG